MTNISSKIQQKNKKNSHSESCAKFKYNGQPSLDTPATVASVVAYKSDKSTFFRIFLFVFIF